MTWTFFLKKCRPSTLANPRRSFWRERNATILDLSTREDPGYQWQIAARVRFLCTAVTWQRCLVALWDCFRVVLHTNGKYKKEVSFLLLNTRVNIGEILRDLTSRGTQNQARLWTIKIQRLNSAISRKSSDSEGESQIVSSKMLSTWTIPTDPGFDTRRPSSADRYSPVYAERIPKARVKPEALSNAIKNQGTLAQLFNPQARPYSIGSRPCKLQFTF